MAKSKTSVVFGCFTHKIAKDFCNVIIILRNFTLVRDGLVPVIFCA